MGANWFVCFYARISRSEVLFSFSRIAVPVADSLQIKDKIAESDGIAITTDGGTNNRTKHYQAVTGHFLDKHFELFNFVLEAVPMSERSDAANLSTKIRGVLHDYGIDESKVTAVCDNAANIVAALGSMDVRVVRCACHTLQLVVLDALKKVAFTPLFAKIRAGCKKIRDSPLLSKIFEDLQRIESASIFSC